MALQEGTCDNTLQAVSLLWTKICRASQVKFRITHPKKLAVEHRVIMTLGVIGQDARATLDAVSDPVGQTNAARTRLAVSGYRHRASV